MPDIIDEYTSVVARGARHTIAMRCTALRKTSDHRPLAPTTLPTEATAVVRPDAPIDQQVLALCAELEQLDQEIATLEPQVAQLPTILAALAGHPVLWLLLGRAGVDRPGGLHTVLGQQVVTVTRISWRAVALVGALMLLCGVAAGCALTLGSGGASWIGA